MLLYTALFLMTTKGSEKSHSKQLNIVLDAPHPPTDCISLPVIFPNIILKCTPPQKFSFHDFFSLRKFFLWKHFQKVVEIIAKIEKILQLLWSPFLQDLDPRIPRSVRSRKCPKLPKYAKIAKIPKIPKIPKIGPPGPDPPYRPLFSSTSCSYPGSA